MKIEASVESNELEGCLHNTLNKKMDKVDVQIVFSEKDMTDYIKVIDQNGIILIEKTMNEAFKMIKEALFNDSSKLEITSYKPTEEGFVFELA